MPQIVEYTSGQYSVNTQVISKECHQLHVQGDDVGIWNKYTKNYVTKEMEPFGDWDDPSGAAYTSLASLIYDLNTFFFLTSTINPLIPAGNEVDTFQDLPDPILNDGQYWLVNTESRTGSVLLFNRVIYDPGIYKAVSGSWDYRGPDVPAYFRDDELTFTDNADTTKTLGFELDQITSANRRVATWPDKDGTVAFLDDASGTVTIHSDVTQAGSGEIITSQERADINGSISVHSDVDLSGVTILDNTILRFDGTNFIPCLNQHVLSRSLLINNTDVLVDKINSQINVQRLVPHKVTVSYQWSLDDAGQDFLAEATFGGIRLQNVLTPPEIHTQEPKDTAGVDPDGRGTNQMHSFSQIYYVTPLGTGNNTLLLQFSGSAGGDLAAMWEASIEIEELISVTGT